MTNANDSAGSHCVWVGDIHQGHSIGLTKREYFAAMAIKGVLNWHAELKDIYANSELIANESVRIADALIAELNK